MELQGFAPQNREGLEFQANTRPEINVQLGVGGLQEAVTVQASSPLIRTRESALLEDGPPDGFMWPENSLVAVAAAAIRAHMTGAIELDAEDLRWAAGGVLFAACHAARVASSTAPLMPFAW